MVSDITNAVSAIETHGGAGTWTTASGFSTPAQVISVITRGDVAWTTATGFATPANVTSAISAIETYGGASPWTTATTVDLTGIALTTDVTAAVSTIQSTGGTGPWTTATGFATPANVTDSTSAILAAMPVEEGHGSQKWTITVEYQGVPIDGVDVELSTDFDKLNVIARGFTKASGIAVFYLDPGKYYLWRQLAGYTFPQGLEVYII